MSNVSAPTSKSTWAVNIVLAAAVTLIVFSLWFAWSRESETKELAAGGTIYHRNGTVAYRGPGWTDSGFAYHDDGARACIGPGRTDTGMGYYRNGATSYVGPGRTNSGYAYYPNGQLASRDGSGISYAIGPGVRLHVSRAGCQVWVEA